MYILHWTLIRAVEALLGSMGRRFIPRTRYPGFGFRFRTYSSTGAGKSRPLKAQCTPTRFIFARPHQRFAVSPPPPPDPTEPVPPRRRPRRIAKRL